MYFDFMPKDLKDNSIKINNKQIGKKYPLFIAEPASITMVL